MLRDIQYDMKKLEETESKLRAISELMSVFSQKVVEQGEMTEKSSLILSVVDLAGDSLNNMKKANKELVRANEYNEAYGRYWSYLFATMAIILILLHILKD